jgi:NADH-quinone oxidoreductase subunit N
MTVPVFQFTDTLVLLPPIVLALFACGILVIDVISRRTERHASTGLFLFGITGLVVTGLSLLRQWWAVSASGVTHFTAAQGSVTLDEISFFTNSVVLGATFLFFLISYRFLEIHHEDKAEYYALALFAQAGMYFMATGTELITLFLGLELTAICFYILVGFTRGDRRSNEAAVKYLLLGAVSSGLILYGFSLFYGIAGSTQLALIERAVAQRGSSDPFVVVGVITTVAGLLFKISAVPAHMWAPDAYDGAPAPVTAYLSVASKVASFALLLRLLPLMLGSARSLWEPLLAIAAIASMSLGTIAALTQERLKRLFAYSSIAHVGYILLGIVAGTDVGLKGVYLYLVVYAIMNLGAFSVLISLNRRGLRGETIKDLRGLAKTHPIHAALFVVLLISLAGLPPTAGFLAKYYILFALIETGRYTLAAIASAYVVVSLYFYFRLVREMYFEDAQDVEPLASSFGTRFALYATSILTVLIGVFPEPLLRLGFHVTGAGR